MADEFGFENRPAPKAPPPSALGSGGGAPPPRHISDPPAPGAAPVPSSPSPMAPTPGAPTPGAAAPTPSTSPQHPASDNRQRPKQRKSIGRRVLTGVGVLLLLLIVLVVFAPTLASTAWVRGMVLGQVNKSINGTVIVGDWRLGWFSGISARDVVVRDTAGAEVIKLKSLETQLTVLEAARMKFDAGRVVIDGLWADVRRDEKGELNLAKLVKDSGEPVKPKDPNAKTTLPDVSATIIVQNSGGAFTDEASGQAANFDLQGEVLIPKIDQPIKHDLQLTTRVGQGRPGNIALVGEAVIAQGNRLQIDLSKTRQSFKANNVDASSFTAFVPPGALTRVEGIFNIELDVQGAADGAVTQGRVAGADVVLEGPALNGDQLVQKRLMVVIPQTVIRLPRDGEDLSKARFQIGAGGQEQSALRIEFDQGDIALRGDLQGQSLARLANNEKPGGNGNLVLAANIDAGGLAQQLRNTFAINKDLQQLAGKLTHNTTLTLQAQNARISSSTRLADVRAMAKGKPVALQPIAIDLQATSFGGGGDVPDLRDLRLGLSSGFANGEITGANLGSISGRITGALDKAQSELSQFIDFGGLKLAGTFEVAPSITGELIEPGGNATANLAVVANDLSIEGLENQPPLREERVQLTYNGRLIRGGKGESFLLAVRNSTLSLQAGRRQNPAVDVALVGDVELAGGSPTVPLWEIRRFVIDLAGAQRDLPHLQKMVQEGGGSIETGRVSLTGRGAYAKNALTLNEFNAALQDVTLKKPDGRPVVNNLTATFDMAGLVTMGEDATRIKLSKLDLSERQNLVSLKKTSGGDLLVSLPKGGGFSAEGQLQVGLSLGFVNQVMRAIQPRSILPRPAPPGQVERGFLDGTLTFAPEQEASTRVNADLRVRNLEVTTTAQPLNAGEIVLSAAATTANDLSRIAVSKLDLGSQFVTVNVSDVRVDMKAASPLAMVQSANVKLVVPDAGKLWTIKEAFAPAMPSKPAEDEEPIPALQVASGRLNVDANITSQNDGVAIALRDLSGSNVRLVRGQVDQTLENFKLVSDARIAADQHGKVARIAVSKLAGSFGFANIEVTQPLLVALATGDQKLSLNGAINGNGDLERTLAVVSALTGSAEKPAYAGAFSFNQTFDTQGNAVPIKGEARISDFRTLGNEAQQIKDEIRLSNDILLNLGDESVDVRNVRLLMPETKAIDLIARGTIKQFNTQRALDLEMTLQTDAEKLWQVVYPMLSKETQESLADAKVFGIDQRTFSIKGAYPAAVPYEQAIRQVVATGGVGLKKFEGMGVDLRDFDAAFELKDGKLKLLPAKQTVRGQYTPNAQVNTGVLNVMNIVVDLANGNRITTPDNYKLAVGVSMNPVLADTMFGKFVNPVFANAKQASGKIDVTIVHCENFDPAEFSTSQAETQGVADTNKRTRQPRGGDDAFERWRRDQKGGEADASAQAAMSAVEQAPGRLQIRYSIKDVQLGSPTLENTFNVNRVNLGIENGEITVANGVVKTRSPMMINGNRMLIDGALRPDNLQILNMVATVPVALLPEKWRGSLPENLTLAVPMTGKMNSPTFDFASAIEKNAGSIIGDVIGDVLKGDEKKDESQRGGQRQGGRQPGGQREPEKKSDPLGGLIDALTDEKKRDRE